MKIRFLFLHVLFCALLLSCAEKEFKIESVKNPWEDDYAYLLKDSLYWEKSGTYNIQDPSVIEFQNEYYMFSADVLYYRMPENIQGGAVAKPGMGGKSGYSGNAGKRAVTGGSGRMSPVGKSHPDGKVKPGSMDQPYMKGQSGSKGFSEKKTQSGADGKVQPNGKTGGKGGSGRFSRGGGGASYGGASFKGRMPMDRAKIDSIIKSRGGKPGKGRMPMDRARMDSIMKSRGGGNAFFAGMKNPVTERGFIQLRKSVDMVNWTFSGWVFDSIPDEALKHLKKAGCNPAMATVSAPQVVKSDGKLRLYYCINIPFRKYMYIGMAESENPAGEWKDAGCVMEIRGQAYERNMKPVIAGYDGRTFMVLSVAGGKLKLFPLDAATGKLADRGREIAVDCSPEGFNLSDLVYMESTGKFYLFGAVPGSPVEDALSVWRADRIEGPYKDVTGAELSAYKPGNFRPVLASYKIYKNIGWVLSGRYDVLNVGKRWFVLNQGRPTNDFRQMILQIREISMSASGWPLVSLERYTGLEKRDFKEKEICGDYEVLCFYAGEEDYVFLNDMNRKMFRSKFISLAIEDGDWKFHEDTQKLDMTLWDGTKIDGLQVVFGHDWDEETNTVIFMGKDSKGYTVLGKRIRSELEFD